LFAQECNKNVFSEEEAVKLSAYGKNLEKSILEKNPGDTALIAKLQGDYSSDLCGYTDESVIKISNYLKELEKLDSINKIVKEVADSIKPVETIEPIATPVSQVNSVPREIIAAKPFETIYFAKNSAQITSSKLIDFLAKIKDDKTSTIEIDGYTDADASDEYNLKLSERRARAVKSYLISRGVKASRIKLNAYGEKNPVADNTTPEGKAKNRRVYITIK
jgi:outer membrane protein OmpA-like peptidoglycan-associated protein